MDALTQGFQLEGLQVAPLTGEVSGPGGRARLDPKVMGVLLVMARNPGQVMTREGLVAQLWGHAVVTDDALTRCFYELRRHLAHAGGDERYRDLIETLPKRGYRLNATVRPGVVVHTPAQEPELPSAPPGVPRRRWGIAAAAVAIVGIAAGAYFWGASDRADNPDPVATVASIAVLPFLDLSEGKDQGYLADGVTEEILNDLAQARNLRVIARTSSFALRDSSLDIKDIGKRLGVDYVLEGSVRRSGDRMRITAQLIHVASDAHIWSRTYDRTLEDLFAVQDEIAASVGAALQVELSGGEAQAVGPASYDAYEQYLQAQFYYHRRAPGDIERAVEYYRRAVEIDPQFARAWAALAGAYSLISDQRAGDKTFWKSQGAAARRAVELEPGLAVAHARLAQYLYRTGADSLAAEHFRKARELDPDDPLVLGFSTTSAVFRGDIAAAIDTWRRLVARDPLSAIHRTNLGNTLLVAGHPEEAVAHLRAAVELSPMGDDNHIDLARGLVLAGDSSAAARIILERPPGLPRDLAFALLTHDRDYGSKARATLAQLSVPPSDVRSSVWLAEAYAHDNDHEAAFRVLESARAECDRLKHEWPYLRWYFRETITLAPFLRPLHEDPRWAALVAQPSGPA